MARIRIQRLDEGAPSRYRVEVDGQEVPGVDRIEWKLQGEERSLVLTFREPEVFIEAPGDDYGRIW